MFRKKRGDMLGRLCVGYGHFFPKFLIAKKISFMSIMLSLFRLQVGFHLGSLGLAPNARIIMNMSFMSTIPSSFTSPRILTFTLPLVKVLSSVSGSGGIIVATAVRV